MGLLDGLLGQVLGGAPAAGQRNAPDLGQILGQVLGSARQGGKRGAPDLSDLLGGLAGGGNPRPGGGGMSAAGGAGIAALIAIALQMLQKNGGLEAIVGKMRQQGHASEADSWIGSGSNAPLTPDVLTEVFGREPIGRAAREMGVSEDDAAGGLAAILPELVNQMTPQGRIESGSDDVVARALEELQRVKR